MTPKGRALISAVAFAAALPLAAWTGTQSPAPGKGLDFPTAVFDFGHIGIDYTVRFRYPVINRSPDTVRVRKVDVHCDCSAAFVADSVLAPGDSTNIHLRFNTRDFYGPQNKSLTITTDREGQSTIDLYYLSIIGQWFNGIKPDPLSVMILPPQKSRKVTIPNRASEWIEVAAVYQLDQHFSVNVVTPKAQKGGAIELEVVPSPELARGTLESNFTVTVTSADSDPTVLTVPVKIVKY